MTRQTPRLLLAASGSQASRHATAVAGELASTFDAQLVILDVVAPVEYRVGRLAPTLPITRRLEDPLTSPVLLEARRVAWARGTSAKTILVAGDPARVIVAVARDLGADLLVIGSTPRVMPSALAAKTRRWLHNQAPCPVLPVTSDRPALAQPGIEPGPDHLSASLSAAGSPAGARQPDLECRQSARGVMPS
jgi:nucleotide-binding universal stress UspA family protein